MTTPTAHNIFAYIKKQGPVRTKQIAEQFSDISYRVILWHLQNLLRQKKIEKVGKVPTIYYRIPFQRAGQTLPLTGDLNVRIEKEFLYIAPTGEMQGGMPGFVTWCFERNLPIQKTVEEYLNTLKKYDAYKKDGLIDGLSKLQKTFSEVFVDALFYLDFYSIERFGKTKLGALLLYAKQSQHKQLIKDIALLSRERILHVCQKEKIEAIGFIPPTLPRKVQFMSEFQKYLALPYPILQIEKIKTPIAVAQKTLSKLEDRLQNARTSFAVSETKIFKNILLIDDALGSGATMNAVAHQFKQKELCTGRIIGLAITGSFNGFDVIQEV